jgi:hypothetical protein
MKKGSIIPIALAAALLLSGLATFSYFLMSGDRITVDAADLIGNPARYEGQAHVIRGSPVRAEGEMFGYYISGGGRKLYLNYTEFSCEECIIWGSVERLPLCDCLAASCNGADCEPPEDGWEFLDTRPSADCDDKIATMVLGNLVVKNFFRCDPGTKTYTYYFQVNDYEDSR